MSKKEVLIATASILFSPALFAGTGGHAEAARWGYAGADGPQRWAALSPEYATCGKGKNQTPIDIENAVKAELAAIQFDYASDVDDIKNNGHTVQANMKPGSSITVDGVEFHLKQFHFHTPSENLVNGKHFPMEMHLVHADDNGNLAVVAVMFEEGEDNEILARLWKNMPQHIDKQAKPEGKVSPSELLPKSHRYFRFTGSLTTPPCSEGVRWFVLKDPLSAGKGQLEEFTKAVRGDCARPVQPLGARLILSSD